MALCTARRKDGRPCQSQALANESRCFFHSQSSKNVRARNRGRHNGGKSSTSRARVKLSNARTAALAIQSPQDVTRLLSEVVAQVAAGTLEPRVANCITYVASAILDSLEASGGGKEPTKIEFIIEPPSDLKIPCGACGEFHAPDCKVCPQHPEYVIEPPPAMQ